MRKNSVSSVNNLPRLVLWGFCCCAFSLASLGESGAVDSNGKVSSSQDQGQPNVGNKLPPQESQTEHTEQNQFYVLEDQENFCWNDPNAPFYQRDSDGAVCCRGKQLPVITVQPETEGECAISTNFGSDGLMNSDSLVILEWYLNFCHKLLDNEYEYDYTVITIILTHSVVLLHLHFEEEGLGNIKHLLNDIIIKYKWMFLLWSMWFYWFIKIDKDGRVVPEAFLTHLSQGLTKGSTDRLKMIMNKYLGCFQPLKNPDMPCYTPLGFQKCFRDALYFLCTNGMPKNNDFSTLPKIQVSSFRSLTQS